MNYEMMKNKILETINSEDVVYDGETISAYDLIKVINHEFGKIKFMINNKDLYTMMFKLPQNKMFKNSLNNYNAKLSYIDFGYEKIFFIFDKEKKGEFACLSVSKDFYGNLVDTNSGFDGDLLKDDFKNEFIKLNEELIYKLIYSMEELKAKYNLSISYGDNKFVFPINLFTSKDMFYAVSEFNDENHILLWDADVYYKGLEDTKFKDNNLIEDNYTSLLKKIPISVNSLNPIYQIAINMCYNNIKEKVLKK